MKIADMIEICNGSERITALASGEAALEISGAGDTRYRVGRITAGGFSESIALPEKLRCHRTNDNLCAEFDTLNVIPFGCEYRVKRHWTFFNNIALLSCDIAADNGGTIRALELEPVEFPFAPAKVEFLIFGEDTLHSVDAPEGELYCGSEVPLMLRVHSASGSAAEYLCGDDIWRHRAAGKIPGAEAQFKITATASGVILERKIFDIPEETAVEKRPWKFKSIFSWSNATPAAAPAAEAEYEDVKFSGIRRAISKSMKNSLSSMAQLTHNFSFDATAIMNYRKVLKAAGGDLAGITLGDIILYAVSRTLLSCPDLNAHMLDDNNIRLFKHVNLGVAVDTPRGLMVPTVFHADEKSLLQISQEVKELAGACRTGAISPDKLSGGSFTVSNLGSFGVESFTPVINPPQTGIIGVCTTVQRPRMGANGIELYPAMTLSLTYDHRAVDGAPASRLMMELCKNLENFTTLLAK